MKTVFQVLISYIVTCLVGIVLTAGLFMVYIGCMGYVVGQPLNLFSLSALKSGFDISLPLVVIFMPMFLILSLIRHSKKNKIAGVITTVVLTCASWAFGIPAYMKYIKSTTDVIQLEKQRLSSGYFRLSENTIYYFTNVDMDRKAEGILIDTTNTGIEVKDFKIIKNEEINIPGSGHFSDILVKRTIEFPMLLRMCFGDLYFISKGAESALNKSYWSWLFFCSFGLSLAFVFSLSGISQWRLINAFSVLVGTGVVLKVNALCLGISFYQKYIPMLGALDQKLRGVGLFFKYMDSPLCFTANVLMILIFTVIGFTALAIKKSSKTLSDKEYVE